MTLPPLPLPLPLPRERIEVRKLGFDKLEVRIGDNTTTLTRIEAFRLLGKLEREAALL